jgi:hypothetical protein
MFAGYGTCFRCGGKGTDPVHRGWAVPSKWSAEKVAEWDAKRLARNERARERAEAKRIEKEEKAIADAPRIWAENVALYPAINAIKDVEHYIIEDIVHKAHRWILTERQVELMKEIAGGA